MGSPGGRRNLQARPQFRVGLRGKVCSLIAARSHLLIPPSHESMTPQASRRKQADAWISQHGSVTVAESKLHTGLIARTTERVLASARDSYGASTFPYEEAFDALPREANQV